MSRRNALGELLRSLDITPVLMDIGASGRPPAIWDDIASHSLYVGFDPDAREIHRDRVAGFHKSLILNEAVTHDPQASTLQFYLTRSPFCSTTLPPDPAATKHWLEQDLFEVQSHASVKATTIDCALRRLQLAGVDWIKVDSQGIDLRLLNSISPDVMSRLMTIDTEPGLISMYQHEDEFVDVHRDLTGKGFWLSALHLGEFMRIRRSTLAAAHLDEQYVRATIRKTPAYCEARYLRTLEWLADHQLSQREYLLLWIFALVDDQYGFALDLGIEFERRFGNTSAARKLAAATRDRLGRVHRRKLVRKAGRPVKRLLGSIADRI